jgi:lysophospholipase L1-like esterase
VQKVLTGVLVLAAIAVFGAAGYLLVHKDKVTHAGDVLPLPTTSVSSSTSASPSSSAPAGPPPVVAFIGDDWTSGVGASSTSKRFTTRLCAALKLHEVNAGVPGSGYAKQGSSGASYATEVAAVVSARPAVVIVSGGRNDVSDDPTFLNTQVLRFLEKLHSRLAHAVLIVVSPMWGDSDPPAALHTLASAIQHDAASAGATYLSVGDPIHGHPSYMANAADPNDAGYAAIAAALAPKLAPLIPRG